MDPLHWRNMFYFSQLKTVTPCDSQLALRKQGEEIFTALSRYVPPFTCRFQRGFLGEDVRGKACDNEDTRQHRQEAVAQSRLLANLLLPRLFGPHEAAFHEPRKEAGGKKAAVTHQFNFYFTGRVT